RNATTPAVHKNQRRCRVSPSQSGIGLLLIILFYRIAEQLHPGVVTGVVRGGTYRIRITKNLTLARTTLQPEQKLRSGLTEGRQRFVGARECDSNAAARGDICHLVDDAQEEFGTKFSVLDPAVSGARP